MTRRPCNFRLFQTCCMRSELRDSLLLVGTLQSAAVSRLHMQRMTSYLQNKTALCTYWKSSMQAACDRAGAISWEKACRRFDFPL